MQCKIANTVRELLRSKNQYFVELGTQTSQLAKKISESDNIEKSLD